MWKPPKNPKIEELTKSSKERSYALSSLPYTIREDGTKGCIWCGDKLKSRHPATRYCKDQKCNDSVWAWANPQQDLGLFFLLQRQDWKCNICQHDYKPFMMANVIGVAYGTKSNNDLVKPNSYISVALKRSIPPALKPEVDHIQPIAKGGQSLGFENHQAICYTCHKAKTKIDNSGPRNKKILP